MLRGWQLRERGTHVATNPSRGVGLHARRPGESTTTVPIPEHLRAGEGAISQPFRRSHQARRSYTQGRNPGPLTPRSSLRATYPKRLPWALTNADPWRGLLTRGNGRPSSKTRPSTSAWSNDPSTPKVGESSLGSNQPREREAYPTRAMVLDQLPCLPSY